MRPEEGAGILTAARPGVLATLGRGLTAIVLAASMACSGPTATAGLRPTETIVGRAALGEEIVLLTDTPSLIFLDRRSGSQRVVPVQRADGDASLWGLGEDTGALYTVAGFDTLVRLDADGRATHAARLSHPIANLVDTTGGMAAQRASVREGEPLLVHLAPDGSTSPMTGPSYRTLGLSAAEENLLQLVRCSPPPAVLCWSAVADGIVEIAGDRAGPWLRVEGVSPLPPGEQVSALERLPVIDLIADAQGGIVMLRGEAGGQRLSRFARSGSRDRSMEVQDLRLLLRVSTDILALDRSGRPVRLSWR